MRDERWDDPEWYAAPGWWTPLRNWYGVAAFGIAGAAALAAIAAGLGG
jgi:hypothetical protein